MSGGLQNVMEHLSSFSMAAEEAVTAVQTDFSSSQASEFSNYSLYGTLALVSQSERKNYFRQIFYYVVLR